MLVRNVVNYTTVYLEITWFGKVILKQVQAAFWWTVYLSLSLFVEELKAYKHVKEPL